MLTLFYLSKNLPKQASFRKFENPLNKKRLMRRLQFIHSGLTLSPEVKPNQKVEVNGVVKMAAQMKFNAWRHIFRQDLFIREIELSLPIIHKEVIPDGKTVMTLRDFV